MDGTSSIIPKKGAFKTSKNQGVSCRGDLTLCGICKEDPAFATCKLDRQAWAEL